MQTQDTSAGENADLQLEIAHLLLIDIVGYSKLLVNEQIETVKELNRIVRSTNCFRKAEEKGELIRLPTGDGMALLFFQSPEEPARCALEISDSLRNYPGIRVRMGVHSGPVNRIADVNDQSNFAGTGINVAQRVMDCGDAGHILLSKHIAEDLAQYGHWQPFLHNLGECEVKHGLRLSVVNLCKDKLGNPNIPEKLRPGKRARQRAIARAEPHVILPPRWPGFLVGFGVLLSLLAVIGAGWLILHRQTLPPVTPSAASSIVGAAAKSIAVLPFENLSDEKENAFFAEGVQDEILTDLSKVADLKVISRTSVLQYRSDSKRNLKQIAAELGVAHILEGTVQRAGSRVRISAQLIDARTDTHVWGTTLDRGLADVFAVQSEVAFNIVGQLRAKLSSAEEAAIKEKPTNDLIAYDRFARAKSLIESTVFSGRVKESLFEAAQLLEQAVSRDSTFLRAFCQLARVHDKIYILGLDHTPTRVALADRAISKAIAINPDAGEVHLAQANHLYSAYRDYDVARRELAIATSLLPNEPKCFELAGFIARHAGDWEASVRGLSKALELDPRNVHLLQQLSLTYEHMRRFAEMANVLDRAMAIVPDDVSTRVARGIVDLEWRADTKPMHNAIQQAIAKDPAITSEIAESWLYLALCERDWAAAERAMAASNTDACRIENVVFPRDWCDGFVARARGDTTGAHKAFLAARVEGEKVVREQPEFGEALCALGMIEAALGDRDKAIDHGERAVGFVPVTKDAINGPLLIQYLAIIYSWTGQNDRAIEQLQRAASIPSTINYGVLRLHPYWDELRKDPRFEKILASLAPKS